jgi:hypothetical protein
MVRNEVRDLWRDKEHAYAVVTAKGATEKAGLSHAEAMTLAEELRRYGKIAMVKHIIGDKSYEVDRYPSR